MPAQLFTDSAVAQSRDGLDAAKTTTILRVSLAVFSSINKQISSNLKIRHESELKNKTTQRYRESVLPDKNGC